ncbi:MAG: glyoxylate reductase [Candidatus Acidiferrum sp.]
MTKPKIFATHHLFDAARQILEQFVEVEYWSQPERPRREELLSTVKDKDGLVCLLSERIDHELLQAAPNLQIVANVAVGFDNIDVAACTQRGVAVTNTPGVLDETTADLAWALLMAVARRLPEGDLFVRSGKWKTWDLAQMVGTDVWGKTLGIVGFGRIGRAVARRAAGFKMKVIYHSRHRVAEELEKEFHAEYRDLNSLLAESDFISIHVPLRPDTTALFDAPKLARMKPSAFLINTSRGPVVDEAALVSALETGKIAGAALDVFEKEPLVHPGLMRMNVVLAPHIGSASLETRTKMACIAAENVSAFFNGQPPPTILNREVLKTLKTG